MKKKIIYILISSILLCQSFVCAEDDSGIVYKEYYADGTVSLEGIMLDGKKQGLFVEYNEQGKRISERMYKNDLLDGVCRNYFETGELSSDWRFSEGKAIGLAKEFYQDGKILRKWDHRKIDKGIILLKEFYSNGKTMSESVFENNSLVSIKRYDQSGKVTLDENYAEK